MQAEFDNNLPEFPRLGDIVIATITDPKMLGAPLVHVPAIVTERVHGTDDNPDAVTVGALVLIGAGVRSLVPQLAQAPQLIPFLLPYHAQAHANTWRSIVEHAAAGQPLVSPRCIPSVAS